MPVVTLPKISAVVVLTEEASIILAVTVPSAVISVLNNLAIG
jgi:hypothetical protein